MSISISKKVVRSCRLILGVIYPISAIMIGMGTYWIFYSDLPNLVTIHFDITRVPTTSLSKLIFGILMSTLIVLSAVACTLMAFSKRSIPVKSHLTIVSYGGFLSAVIACLMAGSVIIHRGLSNWQDATGPGWWLLAVALVGFAGRAGAMYLFKKIDELDSDD